MLNKFNMVLLPVQFDDTKLAWSTMLRLQSTMLRLQSNDTECSRFHILALISAVILTLLVFDTDPA
jgi:hypothetical protein